MIALRRRGGERVAAIAGMPAARPLTRRAVLAALPRMFQPEAAVDLDATYALRVDGEVFGLRIRDSRLTVGDPAGAAAGATVSAADLVRLGAGSVSWPDLLASGRMALEGDPFLGLRFPGLFGLSAR
jgi:hypothetical protein